MRLESLECMDSIMEKFDKQRETKGNTFTLWWRAPPKLPGILRGMDAKSY
jgi:hypothetical protein